MSDDVGLAHWHRVMRCLFPIPAEKVLTIGVDAFSFRTRARLRRPVYAWIDREMPRGWIRARAL